MHLHFQKLTPLLYGMPVSRDRCYMAGVSLQLVHEALEHEESVDDLFDTIYQCLQGNMPRMDIDSFLYPSDHKFVLDQAAKTKSEIEKRHTSKASQRSCGDGKRGAQKWLLKHAKMYRNSGIQPTTTNWTDDLCDVAPGYLILSARQQELLDLRNVGFPHPEKMMIETSQTGGNGSINVGVSPCIIPEQRIWIGHKCRRMLAVEGLRLQGLYMPDSIVQKFDADSSNIRRLAGNAFNVVLPELVHCDRRGVRQSLL